MAELTSLSRIHDIPKQWFEHYDDPNYFAIIPDAPTSIKSCQTHCYPKPEHIVSFHMIEPKQGTTKGLEVKKDPILLFECKKSRDVPLGAIVHGSCNGLIYLSHDEVSNTISLVVIHPIRKECYELPKVDSVFSQESCGLGFDNSTNTFKMVCVLRKRQVAHHVRNLGTMVHVFALIHGGRYLKIPSYPIVDKCVSPNGYLHWLVRKSDNRVEGSYDERKVIYFDVKNEEFGMINPPRKLGGGEIRDNHLVDLNGEVGCIRNYITNDGYRCMGVEAKRMDKAPLV